MLKAKAKIQFTAEGRDYQAHDRFDVTFRFAEGLLFSGRIKSEHEKYINNNQYEVDVDFFTIDNDEALNMVTHTLGEGSRFALCAGSRIIGDAVMTEFFTA